MSKRVVLERHIPHFPDFESFAKSSLCPCPWRGENDATCQALFHTVYRIPQNRNTPQRLRAYHFASVNRPAVHFWCREDYLPVGVPVEEADESTLDTLSNIQPRLGLELALARDPLLEILPQNPKVRARHILLFRYSLAGDVAWHLVKPIEDKPDEYEPIPSEFAWSDYQVVHGLNGRLLWNALQGVRDQFKMWLPEDPHRPITIEGGSTRALFMGMRLPDQE